MAENQQRSYELKHRVRVVTATSLFDGHDAAINIMRGLSRQAERKSSTWGIAVPCLKL